jgi:hypothetical protein
VEVRHYDSSSTRARIHYAASGVHAPPTNSTLENGVPDAVVVAAQAADDALDTFERLGYAAPLGDGESPCASNGDSDAIDIYLVNFSAADGQAVVDHCQGDAPQRCAGFVLVENDFKAGGYANVLEGMRTVVPHELFHLVQDAYDVDVERWWAEGSAQWAAKQVYPELADLERFLGDYFATPWRPINVPPTGVIPSFLYATAIWPVFLSQRYDAELVRQIFEHLGEAPSEVLPATDVLLQGRGSTLAEAYLEFATYNAATGERAPERGGYEAAATYPQVPVEALDGAQGELVSEVGSGLGAYYYSVTTPSPVLLELDADASRIAGALVPLTGGVADVTRATPLPSTLDSGEAIVVVAGQSLARTDAPFTLRGAARSEGGDAMSPESSGCSLATVGGARVSWGQLLFAAAAVLVSRRPRRRRQRGH